MRLAALLLAASGCVASAPVPDAPRVHLVALDPHGVDPRAYGVVDVWSPLGFTYTTETATQWTECDHPWADPDCTITVGIRTVPDLLAQRGTFGLSLRQIREVWLDDDVYATDYDLTKVLAHELGHVLLDTPRHTDYGVMGSSSTVLEKPDYELACETIGVCL